MLKSIMLGTLLVASTGFATAHARGGGPGPMLSQADKDGDGTVSRDEFRNARAEHFARMDRNSDGYLDEADRRTGAKAPQADTQTNAEQPAREDVRHKRMHKHMHRGMHKGMLERLDADGDGRLSKDEFVDGAMPMFDKADTDGNSVLDTKELEAMKQAGKQRLRELRQERSKADGASGN
jgi:Ca2+-binding EF-hand superfamily protein